MNVDTFDLLRELNSYATFTVNDVSTITGKDQEYVKLYLNRLNKKGYIHRLQRDRYTVQNDPFLVATSICWPSYISLWSALRYYDLTEQLPSIIDVLTTSNKSKNRIDFKGQTIRFTKIPSKYLFGYSKVIISDLEVFIAEPEKAVVDSVILKKVSFSEIYDIIRMNMDKLSPERMIDMTCQTGNKAAAKRIGWMLDDLGIVRSMRLHDMSYRTTIALDAALPEKGKKDHFWGVINNIGDQK